MAVITLIDLTGHLRFASLENWRRGFALKNVLLVALLICLDKVNLMAQEPDSSTIKNKVFNPGNRYGKYRSGDLNFSDTTPKKNLNLKLRTEGNITVETKLSNFENPWLYTPSTYKRVSMDASVYLLGMPFKTSVYLTTENRLIYRGDFFRLEFDYHKYQQDLIKKYRDSIEKLKEQENLERLIKINPSAALSQLNQQRLEIRNRIQNLNQIQAGQLKILEEKEAAFKAKAKDTAYLSNEGKRIRDSLKERKSILERLKMQTNALKIKEDSLDQLYEKSKKLSKINQKKTSKDSLEYLKKGQDHDIPNTDEEILEKILAGRPEMKFLSIRNFAVGQITPYLSDLTLNGLVVRGAQIEYRPKKLGCEIVGGGGMSSPFAFFKNPNTFNNYIVGSKFSYHYGKASYIYLVTLETGLPIKNEDKKEDQTFVNSVGVHQALSKKLSMDGELSYSKATDNRALGGTDSLEKYSGFGINQLPAAASVKATYKPAKTIEITGKFRQINPSFRSAGVPFLLKDSREVVTGIKTWLFRNKLIVGSDAKILNDNLLNLKPYTYKIKGLGATLQTNFNRYPNLNFSYQPYEQGNNHPDPAYRTFTQTSVLYLGLNYLYFNETFATNTTIGMIQSNIKIVSLSDPTAIANKMWFLSGSYTLFNKYSFSTMLRYADNNPRIDSIHTYGADLQFNFLRPSRISPFIAATYDRNYNSGYKLLTNTGVRVKLTSSLFSELGCGAGRIHNMWGYNDKLIFSGVFKFSVLWAKQIH